MISDEAAATLAQFREQRVPPAGGAHENLGNLAIHLNGPPRNTTKHFAHFTNGFTEEQRRHFLLTKERRRRHADIKHAPTDTLGTGVSLFHMEYKGGPIPSHSNRKTAPANNFPKQGFYDEDKKTGQMIAQKRNVAHDPWRTIRWGGGF